MVYVRNLLILGCALLFLDYDVYRINICPDWLGYLLCFIAIYHMPQPKRVYKLEIVSVMLVICCIGLELMRFYIANLIIIWEFSIFIMMLDLILFYEIGMWIYKQTEEPTLPTKMKICLLIGTVATLSRCLAVNIPVLYWAMIFFALLYRLYFLYGICCFLKNV